jgi:hypothetical protein
MLGEVVVNASTIDNASKVESLGNSVSTEVDENVLARLSQIESNVLSDFPVSVSVAISRKLRQTVPEPNVSLSYTEINSKSFLELVTGLKNFDIGFNETSVFVDVGSGIAKTVLLIGIMNNFKRSIGIEINDGLYKKGLELIKSFNSSLRSPIDQTEMELIRGDGTFIDWSFANLVYIQAVCFDDGMVERLNRTANKLLPGSVLIIVARKLLDESHFDLIGITKVLYIHGEMPAYIYRKSSKAPSNHPDSLHAKLLEILNRKME